MTARSQSLLHRARPAARGEPRERIAYALERCIVEHGYAATKLIDVAERAKMSPPHMRYYFRGKDDMLAYCYERLLRRVQGLLDTLPAQAPRTWLERLAELMLGGGRRGREALTVLNEANLVVARSPALRTLRSEYDARVVARIESQLAQLPLASGQTAASAAALLTHLLNGLMLERVLAGDDRQVEDLQQQYLAQLDLLLND
ncbi:MAG: TetR/AcrR family transcriptional regulator [Pseudomonadota bacterium]